MKKQFLFLAALLTVASAASAKELTFIVNDVPVKQGETVTHALQDDEVILDGTWSEYSMHPIINLKADFVGEVTLEVVSDPKVSICFGTCTVGTELSFKYLMQSNEIIDLQFHARDYFDEADPDFVIPTYETTFTAYYTNDKENTSKTFTLICGPNAGVEEIAENNNGLSVVEGGIAYALEAPATLTLYSLAGQTALTAPLSGTGVLSTAELPAGIYIYNLNGKAGKIAL